MVNYEKLNRISKSYKMLKYYYFFLGVIMISIYCFVGFTELFLGSLICFIVSIIYDVNHFRLKYEVLNSYDD